MKKLHYISGLPRSGSTLLISILNQNPRFYAEITNPLSTFIIRMMEVMSADPSRKIICPNERTKQTITGMIDGYYSHCQQEIMFNCSREWQRITEHIYEINPNFKMICTVRNLVDILNSFELVFKKRGLVNGNIMYPGNVVESVYYRTDFLINNDSAYLKGCWDGLSEAYYGLHKKHLLLVEYEELINEPKETMEKIYDFIEEPMYAHNFNKVKYSFPEYDISLESRYLHNVGSKIKPSTSPMVLPLDIQKKYRNVEFWRNNV